jgi:hypothetical protein
MPVKNDSLSMTRRSEEVNLARMWDSRAWCFLQEVQIRVNIKHRLTMELSKIGSTRNIVNTKLNLGLTMKHS